MNNQFQLIVLVEGDTDKIIIENIFIAAHLPLELINIQVMDGKKNIRNYLMHACLEELQNVIVLVDSDKPNVPDSIDEARIQLGIENAGIKVYCAVPTIESWIFADDKLVAEAAQRRKKKLSAVLNRMPLPEEIPYPKHVSYNLFGKQKESYDFLRKMDIQIAAARTPSLKNFLEGIERKLLINLNIEDSYARTLSRDILANLVREVSPGDSIIYRTMDGDNYTAENMVQNIEEGSEIGRQYASDLLRIARDMLKRAAQKGKRL